MGNQLAMQRTALTPEQATAELAAAWMRKRREPLQGDVLALLLALSDLETATWERMWHWNWGNLVATQPDQNWYVADDSGNTRKFVAYATPSDGADAFVRQLTRDSREQWRAGLLTGNPQTFVRALAGEFGGPAYFEANPDRYLKAFLQRWERYRGLNVVSGPPTQPQTPAARRKPAERGASDSSSLVVLALAVTVGAVAYWVHR